jgi:integrase/recombinase XerD
MTRPNTSSNRTRRELGLEAPRERRRTVERLERDEIERLIETAYGHSSRYGFLVKMLFYTGARVSEFVQIRVEDLHLALDPPQVYIANAKGGSDGYVPILPAAGAGTAHALGRTPERLRLREQPLRQIHPAIRAAAG